MNDIYRDSINQIIIFLKFLLNFIKTTNNKMGVFSNLFTFGLGVYTGIYVAQNYEMAKVDDPRLVVDKIKKYIDEIMKPKS